MPEAGQEKRIGQLAVERGLMTAEQLEEVLVEHAARVEHGSQVPLGELLVELEYISRRQLESLLSAQGGKRAPRQRIPGFELIKKLGEGGETISTERANYNGSSVFVDGRRGTFRNRTVPAGSLPANAWGLHEMHGNVWEWCGDWYGKYSSGVLTDPTGPRSGRLRVVRGGSWFSKMGLCRSAYRGSYSPESRKNTRGLRLAADAGK